MVVCKSSRLYRNCDYFSHGENNDEKSHLLGAPCPEMESGRDLSDYRIRNK